MEDVSCKTCVIEHSRHIRDKEQIAIFPDCIVNKNTNYAIVQQSGPTVGEEEGGG